MLWSVAAGVQGSRWQFFLTTSTSHPPRCRCLSRGCSWRCCIRTVREVDATRVMVSCEWPYYMNPVGLHVCPILSPLLSPDPQRCNPPVPSIAPACLASQTTVRLHAPLRLLKSTLAAERWVGCGNTSTRARLRRLHGPMRRRRHHHHSPTTCVRLGTAFHQSRTVSASVVGTGRSGCTRRV